MIADFFKFPSTAHLAWLGAEPIREDKVMTPPERDAFLVGEVALEEKIDGANLGLSFSGDGELRFQNRGNWLTPPFRGQWERLRGWVAPHEASLREYLPPGTILFGEWCFARHSIPYSRLPDWFVAFDVYEANADRFWSATRRNELVGNCGLSLVPVIAPPVTPSLNSLSELLHQPSAFGDAQREGLYLRSDENGWLERRAKLVNPGFSQSIASHWSQSELTRNHLERETADHQPDQLS